MYLSCAYPYRAPNLGLSSPLVFSEVRVTRSLVLWVMFCRSLFFLCPSFLWPLCCLSFFILATVLSVLLYFGPCVVCPSLFWPLCCLSFFLLAIVLSVLWFTDSDYTFGIFKLFLSSVVSTTTIYIYGIYTIKYIYIR